MKLNMSTTILVRAQFIAFHRWADCPYEEVAFLRNWHRHVFKVELSVHVTHADRDVEFFMLQTRLQDLLSIWGGGMHDMSCEMFAEKIALVMHDVGFKVHKVTVSEDGENEATVHVTHDS